MLGDYSHQPSMVGEAATTPLTNLSRRSTFDEDSFFSPSQPKTEQRGSHSVPSPQQIQRLPTVHDKVLEWFLGLIENRRLKTAACTSVICTFLYFVTLVSLQFSLASPLRFFKDAFSSTFSLSTWFSSVIIWALSFATCWVLLHFLAKAEQRQRVSWTSADSWLCFLAVMIFNEIQSIALMKTTRFSTDEKFLVCLVILSAMLSAFCSIFRNDFQLNFSGAVTQLGITHTIVGMFAIGYDSVLNSSFREAIRIASFTTVVGCVVGLFSHGFSSLLLLFNITFHIYNIVIIFGQQFVTKALLKLVRHIVMKPISFPLPPSYAVHSPTPEQTRNLVIVLDSQHPLLKMFAFTDLRHVAWTDRNRRLEVFSLSQPGGHPRNWTNVSTACINVLERVQNELQTACSRFESFGFDRDHADMPEDDFAEVDREMLMMPHKSRKQIYSSAVRQRHRVAIRPAVRQPNPSLQLQRSWWKRITSYEEEVVSRYDASIVVLAVESLYMFVVESYQEDRYGVVLKDLHTIIGVFVQLIRTIDKYFRLRASQTLPSGCDSTVKQIDATLQTALIRISGKFGSHLKAVNLSNEQLQTIRMVCQSEI
ncbi:hypothetical protein V3C99_014502 [Haemonchus contortus]